MAGLEANGERRRTRSLDERKRIVREALAPGASVAAVARRHGINSNLVFKWIRRSREGWRDARGEVASAKPSAVGAPDTVGPAFVPMKLLELSATSTPPADGVTTPAQEKRRTARRGAMEISLPNGVKVVLDADVDAEALRCVLSALGLG